jgi:hypothetical protein
VEEPDVHEYGPPERVYVENEWYDGPRAGIADVAGAPHRFKSLFDEAADEYLGTFLIWPIDQGIVALEVEQWRIFVEWNAMYEAGLVSSDSHPGHGGLHKRWNELQTLLEHNRSEVPPNAKRALAQMTFIDQESRYAPSGPAYMLGWRILQS